LTNTNYQILILDMSITNKRGRPKGPEKVAFYRKVEPSKIPALLRALEGDGVSPPTPEPQMAVKAKETASGDVMALLDTVDDLTKKVEDYERRLERCARATDDMKARHWMVKYDEVAEKLRKLEELHGP
jgi:hypothetical protein